LSDIDFQKHIFAMTNLALASALADTLVMLSKFRGPEDTKWLDDLEAKIISDLKNSHTEGMDEKNEIKIVKGALAFLKVAMDDARASIIDAAKE
jgi:hypothetical protein